MAKESVRKVNRKKTGRTLMEKRSAKKAKNATKSAPLIPSPSGR